MSQTPISVLSLLDKAPVDRRPVLSKRDFAIRYKEGEFGNAAPTWDTLQEFLDSGYRGYCHIRNRVAGGPTWYNTKAICVTPRWNKLVDHGTDPGSLYISAMAPHDRGTIQGEVMQTEQGLGLLWTMGTYPMRDAMRLFQNQVYRLEALRLLKQYLCWRSYDWLQFLLDAYPFHVIEFSSFEISWGTIPGFNTVTWEVRRYLWWLMIMMTYLGANNIV